MIPICVEWFGEINTDFDKTIMILSQEVAAGEDGIGVCPLVNTNKKGGSFPLILQQFRRDIGVAIVRGNTNHKLGILYYVKGTSHEAGSTYRSNYSNYGYGQS